MKKFFAFAVILALLVPAAAFAAAEFTLGGFVKLDSFWSSTQDSKNMLTPIARSNDPSFNHGRMKFTAQGSRFNFTIKGPKLFGATTTGFIEMDFDSEQQLGAGSANADSASQNYKPRLRHAMFRFNWPTTELLFGQYWSMFCEFYNESVQDGPLMGHGMPTARLPQVRVSQQFMDGFTVAGLIGNANAVAGLGNGANTGAANLGYNYTLGNSGENAEMPQVQGKIMYQKDLWGKAAYYGAPMPFTARIIGGWQRNVFRSSTNRVANSTFTANTFGNAQFGTVTFGTLSNHQYLNPWMIMANTFLPVIPTHSANLAGTASINLQAYLGQGVGAFGENMGNDVYAQFSNQINVNNRPQYAYEQRLYQRFGGYAQAQYYFTNHWFANVTYGFSKIFGVDRGRNVGAVQASNPAGFVWAGADQPTFWQEVDVTLWYRPIQAIKFGLQYAYQRTTWIQTLSGGAVPATGAVIANGPNQSNSGTSSRVEFVGFFYF
jgi:hypothetical protein